eukprot:ctg_172.g96
MGATKRRCTVELSGAGEFLGALFAVAAALVQFPVRRLVHRGRVGHRRRARLLLPHRCAPEHHRPGTAEHPDLAQGTLSQWQRRRRCSTRPHRPAGLNAIWKRVPLWTARVKRSRCTAAHTAAIEQNSVALRRRIGASSGEQWAGQLGSDVVVGAAWRGSETHPLPWGRQWGTFESGALAGGTTVGMEQAGAVSRGKESLSEGLVSRVHPGILFSGYVEEPDARGVHSRQPGRRVGHAAEHMGGGAQALGRHNSSPGARLSHAGRARLYLSPPGAARSAGGRFRPATAGGRPHGTAGSARGGCVYLARAPQPHHDGGAPRDAEADASAARIVDDRTDAACLPTFLRCAGMEALLQIVHAVPASGMRLIAGLWDSAIAHHAESLSSGRLEQHLLNAVARLTCTVDADRWQAADRLLDLMESHQGHLNAEAHAADAPWARALTDEARTALARCVGAPASRLSLEALPTQHRQWAQTHPTLRRELVVMRALGSCCAVEHILSVIASHVSPMDATSEAYPCPGALAAIGYLLQTTSRRCLLPLLCSRGVVVTWIASIPRLHRCRGDDGSSAHAQLLLTLRLLQTSLARGDEATVKHIAEMLDDPAVAETLVQLERHASAVGVLAEDICNKGMAGRTPGSASIAAARQRRLEARRRVAACARLEAERRMQALTRPERLQQLLSQHAVEGSAGDADRTALRCVVCGDGHGADGLPAAGAAQRMGGRGVAQLVHPRQLPPAAVGRCGPYRLRPAGRRVPRSPGTVDGARADATAAAHAGIGSGARPRQGVRRTETGVVFCGAGPVAVALCRLAGRQQRVRRGERRRRIRVQRYAAAASGGAGAVVCAQRRQQRQRNVDGRRIRRGGRTGNDVQQRPSPGGQRFGSGDGDRADTVDAPRRHCAHTPPLAVLAAFGLRVGAAERERVARGERHLSRAVAKESSGAAT